jgi:secondary thiamine-phosphate synthase enzyme
MFAIMAAPGQGYVRFHSMDTTTISVHTGHRRQTVDITARAAQFVMERGDGLLSVFVPHATAGLAIVETGAGSDADLLDALDEMLPRDDRWRHQHGSPGHGADHVMPAFISPSVTIPVQGGRLLLGTWQSLVLVDPNADNPERHIRLSWIPA